MAIFKRPPIGGGGARKRRGEIPQVLFQKCPGCKEVVHEFKYGHHRHLRYPLAGWLGEAMSDPRLRSQRFDVIVPVPLHPARERERGFNQATLLAELLSGQIGVPLRPVLERIRFTQTQTAHDRAERMENLRDAFRLRKKADVRQ